MARLICLWFIAAASALAQSGAAPDLTRLEQTARQRGEEWSKLAQALEPSIARLLPCDAKVTDSITAVSRASEVRLAALSAYLNAFAQQGLRETEAARRVLASGQTLESELGEEKSDLAQEQSGVEMQLADLTANSKQRPSLGDAQAALQQIAAMVRQRSDQIQSGLSRREALEGALRDLIAAFEARDAARKSELGAFETERIRWTAYYTARLARAQTECAVTRGADAPTAAPARRQGKKQ